MWCFYIWLHFTTNKSEQLAFTASSIMFLKQKFSKTFSSAILKYITESVILLYHRTSECMPQTHQPTHNGPIPLPSPTPASDHHHPTLYHHVIHYSRLHVCCSPAVCVPLDLTCFASIFLVHPCCSPNGDPNCHDIQCLPTHGLL